ncbi:MAG: cell division protein FtsL [Actinobacteria bacterium]|nr:cell division protein FtsL [Actinomycetota bacterium]
MAVVAFPLPVRTPAPRRQPTAPERNREAVKLVRPARTRALPRAGRATSTVRRRAAWGLVSLIAAVALAVSACQVLIAQSQFELARLQSDAATAEDRYDRLRLQVAELESPGRIMATAQERLGMVPPPGVTYLTPVPSESATPTVAPARPSDEAVADDWSRIKPILATRP